MSKFKVSDKIRVVKNTSNNKGKDSLIGKEFTIIDKQGLSIGGHGMKYGIGNLYIVREDEIEFAVNTYELHITCNDGKTTNAVYKVNGKIEKRTEAKCSPSDTFDFAIGAQEAFDRVFSKTQPISPQEVKPKFSIGQRVIATDNTRHFIKQIATILNVDKSDPFAPFEVKFEERGLIMWCHSGDIEPYTEPEKVEPKYYNGKVVCVDNGGSNYFEIGKVYQFIGGVVFGAKGFYSSKYETLEAANARNGIGSKFIEFLGE